jgi:tRNA dimethylallyltransferase
MDSPAVAIIGPTASGKSALGLALAARFSGEILTCDALQVYRHMDIGTAKPGPAERSRIPHHLLDIREPCDDFSAGDYLRLGRAALKGIRERGRVPFVVGGTGFYFKALTEGMFEGPGRSDPLRARMRLIVARRGPETIHRALRRADPETAAHLAPADAERNIRAYEIYLTSGRTMSWWQNQPRDHLKGFRWLKLAISWPHPAL